MQLTWYQYAVVQMGAVIAATDSLAKYLGQKRILHLQYSLTSVRIYNYTASFIISIALLGCYNYTASFIISIALLVRYNYTASSLLVLRYWIVIITRQVHY